MGDVSEEEIQAFESVMLPQVREAYTEEERFAAAKIQARIEAGKSWIQEALTWAPYIGSIFEEDETGPQAAVDDVNLEARGNEVIQKIETRLGLKLDDETKKNIQEDVRGIWGFS